MAAATLRAYLISFSLIRAPLPPPLPAVSLEADGGANKVIRALNWPEPPAQRAPPVLEANQVAAIGRAGARDHDIGPRGSTTRKRPLQATSSSTGRWAAFTSSNGSCRPAPATPPTSPPNSPPPPPGHLDARAGDVSLRVGHNFTLFHAPPAIFLRSGERDRRKIAAAAAAALQRAPASRTSLLRRRQVDFASPPSHRAARKVGRPSRRTQIAAEGQEIDLLQFKSGASRERWANCACNFTASSCRFVSLGRRWRRRPDLEVRCKRPNHIEFGAPPIAANWTPGGWGRAGDMQIAPAV